MPFDLKEEYKECYMPKNRLEFVTVKPARCIATRGKGDPNEEGGEYQCGVGILYAAAYTIKMNYKGPHKINGSFGYVVPPLEGFWWQDGIDGVDYSDRSSFSWISAIRLPDFVKKGDSDWAVREAEKKKKLDCSLAKYLTIDEGLCVQITHHSAYDEESVTVARMNGCVTASGYEDDSSATRLHREIYLSDPEKTEVSRRKTVARHPVKMGTEETPRVYIERQEDVRR